MNLVTAEVGGWELRDGSLEDRPITHNGSACTVRGTSPTGKASIEREAEAGVVRALDKVDVVPLILPSTHSQLVMPRWGENTRRVGRGVHRLHTEHLAMSIK